MPAPSRDDLTRCARIRWKGLFIESEADPGVPPGADGYCWCTHTMNCLGPDGKVAGAEECRPGRCCFTPLLGQA